jgi:hypothetical protein
MANGNSTCWALGHFKLQIGYEISKLSFKKHMFALKIESVHFKDALDSKPFRH